MLFADRAEAGRLLAERLTSLPRERLVVLALPRGGVPVALPVARRLAAPLDIILVRKVGVPAQPELAMGAIGEGDVLVVDQEVVRMAGVSREEFAAVEARERAELERRAAKFRGGRPRVAIEGNRVVVIDDGIATGSTMRAACRVARAGRAEQVVVATPVAPVTTVANLAADADDVVVLSMPARFAAIGQFYRDFTQTSDDEVLRLLSAG